MPKAILGVMPPSQDGFPIEGDFATVFSSSGEEIVDKDRESMS
jgi:hypothetical protein